MAALQTTPRCDLDGSTQRNNQSFSRKAVPLIAVFTALLRCLSLLIHTWGDICLCVSEAIVTMRTTNDNRISIN
ncbi:hypothetical protein C0J52_12186 [Blattella germanica]|nr:hypothetical protein C0J52_12186 [Blattella germanica]